MEICATPGEIETLPARSAERGSGREGFTLIEFIGVLAVVAVLAAVFVPAGIRQMDQAARTKEAADLNSISNAIVLQILNTKTILDETGLAQSVANWAQLQVSQVTTNRRRYARAFLIDTNGTFGWPYAQNANGLTTSPTNARIMVLGTVATALPITSSRPSSAAFNAIWNTPAEAKPSISPWTNWPGKGEDPIIQRINLEPLFHHLVLVNRDPVPPTNAWFSIDSTNAVPLTNGVRRTYYLDGTDVGLYAGPSAPSAHSRALLEEDKSFVFQAGRWAGQIDPSEGYSDVVGNEFAKLAADFLATEWYPGAHKGGNQQGAIVAMFNFMLTYQFWANQCPHFPTRGEQRNNVPEYLLMLDMAGNGASSLLNSFTGTDGLLKKP